MAVQALAWPKSIPSINPVSGLTAANDGRICCLDSFGFDIQSALRV